MKSANQFNASRRDFLYRMSIMGAAAATVTALPLTSFALTDPSLAQWRGESPSGYTFVDEALDNYPGYSAAIGFGRGHLFAGNNSLIADGQLIA